jgi:hypothetical protein
MPSTRGIPLQGSTAKHDMEYPERHSSDLEDGTPVQHNPVGTATGNAPVWDGSKYVSTDVLTPTEHTAIGDTAPHHAAVTLGGGNDAGMATLATQALTVVLKDHDHTGDAGDGGQLTNIRLKGAAGWDQRTISPDPPTDPSEQGLELLIQGSSGSETAGLGGGLILKGGPGATEAGGGTVEIKGGDGGSTSGDGGDVAITGGLSPDNDGGNIALTPGTGHVANGVLKLTDPTSAKSAILDMSDLATADKTFTFPNKSGTFALLDDVGGAATSYYEPVIVVLVAGDPQFVWDLSDDIVMAEVAL